MMYNILVILVDELWLKGKNRHLYFKALKDHVKEVLKVYHGKDVKTVIENQRLIVESTSQINSEVIEKLTQVPGINAILPSIKIDRSFDLILPAIINVIKVQSLESKTFKVLCKRADKTFPINSMDINKYMGEHIGNSFEEMKVDVINPELYINIKIYGAGIYISIEKIMGMQGLPWGKSGHVSILLSGGIDSPVASYLMGKRGCRQSFIFFYSYPFVGEEVKEKIFELAKILGGYQRRSDLYIVPFGEIQKKISKGCRAEYRTMFFRKYMYECAEKLNEQIDSKALVTGDSLGQVSSQTLDNLVMLNSSMNSLILRPLVGLNKSEIIKIAKKIGTYDTSILPYDDACSLFSSKFPIIRPDLKYWRRFEDENNFSQEINESLSNTEKYYIDIRGKLSRVDWKKNCFILQS